jgi:hypothetical protein
MATDEDVSASFGAAMDALEDATGEQAPLAPDRGDDGYDGYGDDGYGDDGYGYGDADDHGDRYSGGMDPPESQAPERQGGLESAAERNAARIVLGLLVIGIGVFLLLFYVPSKQPWQETFDEHGILVSTNRPPKTFEWRFSEELYLAAQGIAGGVIAFGLIIVIAGAMFRPDVEMKCRRCKQFVLAEKDGIWLRCTRGDHTAGLEVGTTVLLMGFGMLVMAMVITIALGSITHVRG